MPGFPGGVPARQHESVSDNAPGLLDPLDIGPRTAPNRIVFGPHETNLGRGRAISERHLAYYARRAESGTGLIVTEEASVHPSDWPYERAPLATECARGWSDVAAACRPHGAVVLAALGHSGGQGTSHWSQRELWAPSRVPEVNTREVPKWMEADDIRAVIDGFAEAARIACEAGCHGVEINAGQHSLARQFLSGLTNMRDDEWGADRTLFLREVLEVVRRSVGDDSLVALRLCGDELAPWAGITPDQAPALAADLVASPTEGRVDLLSVVRGSIYSVGATRPDGHTPQGFNLDLANAVAAAVDDATGGRVPVVAQGSIVDAEMAHRVVREGPVAAVEMTRAQIADPRLVMKLRAGAVDQIRPCVLCNQMCPVRDNRNPIVSCTVEPFSGHETEDTPVAGVALSPVDVLVVGGGPAGLEAARVAALRGHRVRLAETGARLGGRIPTVSRQPGRERFTKMADWLEGECRRLGVDIRTEHRVSLAEAGEVPNLILATGGRDSELDQTIPVQGSVLAAGDVLDDPSLVPDGEVLVWDPIGGPTGVAVAEVLAAAGRVVHVATPDFIVGNELARSGDLGPANARLAQAGVQMHRRQRLRRVGVGVAVLSDRFGGDETHLDVGVVVNAGARLPSDRLGEDLHVRLGHAVPAGGDCVAPRTLHEAILEGRRRALELG